MTVNLSTVMAYMSGVDLLELHLPLFPLSVNAAQEASPSTEEQASATRKMADETNGMCRRGGTSAASLNNSSRSAEWMWRVRQEFISSVLAQKDQIIALPPTSQKEAAPSSDRPGGGNHLHCNLSSSPHLPRPSRDGVVVPPTGVVAQTLPCLGCTPPAMSTLPSSSSFEDLRWGVPRWPACTITVKASWKSRKGREARMSDGDGSDPQESCDAALVSFPCSADGVVHETAIGEVTAAASAAVSTTTMRTSSTGGGQGVDEPTRCVAPPGLLVRVLCGRGLAASNAVPAPHGTFSANSVAVFCDPAPTLPRPLPSLVQPPLSLLLPDAVCLRQMPPSSFLSTNTSAATSTNDGPTVEVLLVAVETLPELLETRRQGLMLYTEVLQSHYAARKVDLLAHLQHSDGRGLPGAGPSELPPLHWRCEVWTPPAEGVAAWSSSSAPASVELATSSIACRTVVQVRLSSVYPSNDGAVTTPLPSLGDGPAAAAAAVATPSAGSLGLCVMGRGGLPPEAARAPSPTVCTPVCDLEAHLLTFCSWWKDMEKLVQSYTSLDSPSPFIDNLTSRAMAPTTADTAMCSSSSVREAADPPESTVWIQKTVEQLLLWWAAKSVRFVATQALRSSSISPPPLPPLPSAATPLFGAIIIPAHARVSPVAMARGVSGAPSPPVMSLPSLTLCFVNSRGVNVHQYDLEALNVLCRAVHVLRASVCVFDASQKDTLMAWMRDVVHPFPAATATAAPSSSSPSSVAHHADSVHSSLRSTTAATTSAAAASFEYPYDALAEVERSCLVLEDYAYERHRRVLAGIEEEASMGAEVTSDSLPQAATQSPLPSCDIAERARTGAAPSRAWLRDARVLACADFLGRRRLDIFTSPLRRPSQPVPASTATNAASPPEKRSSPPLLLNSVPPSFLSYVLTCIEEKGVEEVEQLSGALLQMGRRLSEVLR
ncbi:hypothetical protein ABL78_7319 [Leptomonas seymouri]|uniref:Uncharacterized protein n=1 Tax=Leptomonas seymouri TaxID=5684 RepID=A0A0N0P3G4_LEPSE|nr:hypothetical protein ABL78_7319 [Leptomonas seymouri]|eukprot:KPI83647.1 hypothetical protein ABL78_7319 [Leptomonas seymouri]